MGYGKESLTREQKEQFENALMINNQTDRYRGEGIDYVSGFVWNGFETDTERSEYEKRVERSKVRHEIFEKSANRQKGATEETMQRFSDEMVQSTSWLKKARIPKKTKIDDAHKKAAETFGLKSLSWNQRTKRGKKFKNKAIMQAHMINTMKKCNLQREAAMSLVMESHATAVLMQDKEYLENIGDENNVDLVAPMMKDIAFLHAQDIYRERATTKDMIDETPDYLASVQMQKMADPKTRNDTFVKVLEKFAELDLNKFNYKSDAEFAKDEGDNSFTQRYAELKAYSHAYTMLRMVDYANKNEGMDLPDSIAENMDLLHRKARVLQDILLDYNNRAMLLQSPYYVLLAGKDLDDLSNDDLELRIGRTEDRAAKMYLQLILDQRSMKGFAKGKKAGDFLTPGKEISQKEKEKFMAENNTPKTIDGNAACTYLPYLAVPTEYLAKEKKLDSLKSRIMNLHRNLNMTVTKLDKETLKEEIDVLWRAVDAGLYGKLLASQQRLENTRARVAALMKLEKEVTYQQSLDIQDEIRNILTGEEYLDAFNELINNTNKMEVAFKNWQTEQTRLRQHRFDNMNEEKKEEKKPEKVKKPEAKPVDAPEIGRISVQDFDKIWNADKE